MRPVYFFEDFKPTAFLKFSHNALIAPYGEISALMLRTTPYKNTNFTDAEVKMTLGIRVEEDGKIMVFIKTFDNMFIAVVNTSTSYTFKEVIYRAKFEIMYSQNKSKTILHLDKLNSFY